MSYKIAVITPKNKNDYLTDTVIDGLLDLNIEFRISSRYPTHQHINKLFLPNNQFIKYATSADLIILCWGKTIKKFYFFEYNNTDYKLSQKINRWDKTVFVDGSEVGRDGRAKGLFGKIDNEMLNKSALYFRREKPYPNKVIPLPFGITREMIVWNKGVKKDIDFFCVFGKYDQYLPYRKQVREELEAFCKLKGFSFVINEMPKEEYREKLARSKVGISVGGGGYDTARFWEILGNNCILLTENIDIYESNSERLRYDRIWQFKDLEEFKEKLEKMGQYLKSDYDQNSLDHEYQKILTNHSSKSRVLEIIKKSEEKGIIV